MVFPTVPLLSLPSIPSIGIMETVLFLIGLALPVALYLIAQRTTMLSLQEAVLSMGGLFILGAIALLFQQGFLPTSLPTLTIPSVSPTDVLLFVIGLGIPISLYLVAERNRDVSMRDVAIAIGGLLVLVLLVLVYDTGALSVSLPSITIPMIPIPEFTFTEVLMLIIATAIPITVLVIGQLTRIIKWMDVAVAMGLMLVPMVVILGLGGFLSATAVTATLGILVAHALGIIVVD